MNIGITMLETGTVRMRPAMRTQPADKSVLRRRLRLLTDRSWTEPFPVATFLIHHPEGPILFDTGQSPRCNEPGYLPAWMPALKMLTQFSITPEQGIGAQLRARGVEPKRDLKAVVLSHLHNDHAGGLGDLDGVPVYVSKPHWDAFGSGHHLYATIEGCLPQHWPRDFAPRLLEPKDHPVGPWKQTYPITTDGRVVAVDTPGHVAGHISLIVFADDATFFLTGDATYGIDLLKRELTDGVNDDPLRAVQSERMINEYARSMPVVVLPSHDAQVARILAEHEVYRPPAL